MAIIYTYPIKANPVDGDLVLISDSADGNNTKQVSVSSIRGATVSGVASVTLGSAVASTGNALTISPVTGSVVITPNYYGGATKVGYVPIGGSSSTYLRGDGTWVNPPGSIYSVMGSGNSYAAGLVLAGDANPEDNFLRKDGTWAIPPNTTYTQGSGITITGVSISNSDKGSSQLIFRTVAVTGQTSIAATSNTDTINFQGPDSSGIKITTVVGSKTVVIKSNLGYTPISYSIGNELKIGGSGGGLVHLYEFSPSHSFTCDRVQVYVGASTVSQIDAALFNGTIGSGAAKLGQGSIAAASIPDGLASITLVQSESGAISLTAGSKYVVAVKATLNASGAILFINNALSDNSIAATVTGGIPVSLTAALTYTATTSRPCVNLLAPL